MRRGWGRWKVGKEEEEEEEWEERGLRLARMVIMPLGRGVLLGMGRR